MLLESLELKGVRVDLDGEDLRVRIAGQPSQEQIDWLREHKPDLVAELKTRRSVPPPLSDHEPQPTYYGFTLVDLKAEAHPDEWDEVKDNPEILEVFALSLLESRQMAACVTPERFTKLARCRGCGAVMVPDTWPTERVKHELGLYASEIVDECSTCPWCRLRHQGKNYPKPCPTDRDGKTWPRPIAWQGVDERPATTQESAV